MSSTAFAADSGSTYYVDSVAGDDDNNGISVSTAWKNLPKINGTTFLPGDRILLKAGSTWRGQLWPKGSGAPDRPIVIDKYGGDVLPIINGTEEDAVLLKNQEYWEMRNLEITNKGNSSSPRRGVNLVAENSGDLHHIFIENFNIHDVNGIDKDKVNGGINYHVTGDKKPSRFVDLRIENNRITHVDRSGIFGWSTHWIRSKWYPSLGVVIRNNVLEDIGGDGIVNVATDGAIVEHNIVSHANQRSEGYDVGIWPWSADNTLVQFNEVYGTHGQRDGEGFDSDWNSRNTIIQYNYSHENDGGFLLICDDGSQDAGISAGNTGTIVRYNISQNDHHRGINISGPVKNTLIYNNTIYTGKKENIGMIIYSDWSGWASDTSFFNNIFYVDGEASFSYAVSRAPDGEYKLTPGAGKSTGNIFDSNVYYGLKSIDDDSQGLKTNPMLAGAGTAENGINTLSGYALQTKSPAIDSGRKIENNGGRDFAGVSVPQCNGVDRGAMESTECIHP